MKVKIFRGMCAEVELQINAWLATESPIIKSVHQTECDTNTLTITILYINTTGV